MCVFVHALYECTSSYIEAALSNVMGLMGKTAKDFLAVLITVS